MKVPGFRAVTVGIDRIVSSNLPIADRWTKFSAIDRSHFQFWRSEETQVGNNGNPFGSPAPVTGNINGGLGIWGGYSTTFDTIIAR